MAVLMAVLKAVEWETLSSVAVKVGNLVAWPAVLMVVRLVNKMGFERVGMLVAFSEQYWGEKRVGLMDYLLDAY